jgi:hypothetical protein
MSWDFSQFGGVPMIEGKLLCDSGLTDVNPDDLAWNFGVQHNLSELTTTEPIPPIKTLYEAFPNLQGKWDGKTTINHHEAVRKVLGRDLSPHAQVAGTCGSHAGSRGLELLQCSLIANGKRAKYHDVSHAWLYYLARKMYGMLGGGDGVAGGSIPEAMAKFGALHRVESDDLNQNSDNLAVRWGRGQMSAAEYKRLSELARDNIVTAKVRCRSASELADGLAAGGVGIVSDGRGFTMTRDKYGFCDPKGTWWHYHVRSGVRIAKNGRRGFVYDQSWGENVPNGDLVDGCPSNCFLVDWDVMDASCRNGEADCVFAFDLWDLEQGNLDPWVF